MESIITWSFQPEEDYMVLTVKFRKDKIPTIFKDTIMGKDNPEKAKKIGERLSEFYGILLEGGFSTIGGGEIAYGKDKRTTLKVEIIL